MVADFSKKGNREFLKDKRMFRGVAISFLVVIAVLIVADFRIYQKKKDLSGQIKIYQKQVADIEKSSKTLNAEIVNSDNKDYLEKLGYEQFDQTRPGETEYMFVKAPSAKVEVTPKAVNFWDLESWSGWLSSGANWIKSKF